MDSHRLKSVTGSEIISTGCVVVVFLEVSHYLWASVLEASYVVGASPCIL